MPAASAQGIGHSRVQGQRALADASIAALGAPVERALNAEVWTTDGRRHIDFSASAGIVGHRNEQVTRSIAARLGTPGIIQASPALDPDAIRLAERLTMLHVDQAERRTMLYGSDAEAIEGAIVYARRYTRRPILLAFSGAAHGHGNLGVALSGLAHWAKAAGGSYPPFIHHLPFPHVSLGVSLHETRRAFEHLTQSTIMPSDIAAIIVEPIQREGGILPCSAELLGFLRATCDQHGIVLIADETRTALGPTGRMLAADHFAPGPDLIVMGGALAAGMPLSAVVGAAAIMGSALHGMPMQNGAVNTLALAAAHAVLDLVQEAGLCERAVALGRHWTARMNSVRPPARLLLDLRGLGALRGIELRDAAGAPAAAQARTICDDCLAHGLLLHPAGPKGNVIPFLFPLTIELPVLDEALGIFADALHRVIH
ncbi:aminotransferase class III-fold pyridoxal phosphate-dependent enzyme [Bordetella sp. BOR01]|uniref:aminotransferase class III-fold pyridoxal phosphate-dependent enzyme n=1 Tax=Bordetella sp. BOR01 TaxID=2854779 RepID=UPI001C443BFF|nr:aminotransferase class III-fold pyridoxal phosphate-dependent enzyme [Bordetella sp. BOR01]MBV7487078.1 aminotransferase class III-fold pyridoxal phosphate-dependent enzyme [Bordetella sp. BOR01]